MLSATLRRATRLARAPRLARGMAEEAAAATGMTLNFTVPASAIYENVPAEMVLVPCGHQCLCEKDSAALKCKGSGSGATKCPICRSPVECVVKARKV